MEPNLYLVNGLIDIKGLEVKIVKEIMAMVVNNMFIVCIFHSLIARSKKVQRFHLLHTM